MTERPPAPHEALIARIAEGDRDAFASLYRECRADVYRFAAHMSGSCDVAEDVVQDVFMAVIREARRYQPGRAGVMPWLLGIARNHVRRWRHRRIALPLPVDESADGRRLALVADPVGELTRQRHEAALSRALVALPPRYREVIVLCDLQEQSYEAAAGAIGCAIGTVRSRLHRARARLGTALSGLDRDTVCAAPAAAPGTRNAG